MGRKIFWVLLAIVSIIILSPAVISFDYNDFSNVTIFGSLVPINYTINSSIKVTAYWESYGRIMSMDTESIEYNNSYYFVFYNDTVPKDAELPVLLKAEGMQEDAGYLITQPPSVLGLYYAELVISDHNIPVNVLHINKNLVSEETLTAFGLKKAMITDEWRKEMITRFIIMVVFIIFLFGFGVSLLNSKSKTMAREISENLKAKNFMTRTIITIDENAPINEAIMLLVRHNLGSLIVIRKDKPVGIITERDIFKKSIMMTKLRRKLKVRKFMSEGLIMAKEDDLIFDVEQIMFKNQIRRVPIVSENKIIGIVTASDLLGIWNESTEGEVLKHIRLLDQKMKVKYWMTTQLVEMDLYDKLIDAYEIMDKKNISDVIIMDGTRIVGILTQRDIVSKFLLRRMDLDKTTIADVIRRKVITIDPDMELFEAAKVMDANHIRRLPIVDDEKLLGIITATDLVKAWAKISRQYR